MSRPPSGLELVEALLDHLPRSEGLSKLATAEQAIRVAAEDIEKGRAFEEDVDRAATPPGRTAASSRAI